MTLLQARNLLQRQIQKSGDKITSIAISDKRVNPRLAKQILLQSNNQNTMIQMLRVIRKLAMENDKKIVEFLNKNANEKVNPNSLSRIYITMLLSMLTKDKVKGTLKGLMVSLKDSNIDTRKYAVKGLTYLAEQGVNESLKGLIIGSKDVELPIRQYAYSGIIDLSKKGNQAATKYLVEKKML